MWWATLAVRYWKPLVVVGLLGMLMLFVPVLLVSAVAAQQPDDDESSCDQRAALEAVSLPGVAGLTADQLRNAGTIIAAGKSMRVPEQGWIVALATARQESGLVDLAGGHADSIGLFQQRPSQGWGTPTQVHDPTFASRAFFTRLLAVPGWQDMPVTVAAQTVQASAFPDAYAQWEPMARQIVAKTPGGMPAAVSAATSCATGRAAASRIGPISQQGCTNPLPASRISQHYGVSNGRDANGHPGVDLAGVPQASVVAACPGTIVFVGPATGFGQNVVIEDLGSGYFAIYGHMNASAVTVGQHVEGGTPVGTEGWQGTVSPPGVGGMHLHFQINTEEQWGPRANPEAFLAAVGVKLS